jgi:hypothetical protein
VWLTLKAISSVVETGTRGTKIMWSGDFHSNVVPIDDKSHKRMVSKLGAPCYCFCYIEYNIYCVFINTVDSYIRQSYFHPFQQFFIHIDKFYPFFIHCSSNLPILNNFKKIVWLTIYAVFNVVIVEL